MFGLLHHLFHPTNCYALCSVARSGAHLLTRTLQTTHLVGRPLQYFSEKLAPKYAARYGLNHAEIAPYVRGLIVSASTANHVFGFRMEAMDLDRTITRLRESREFSAADAREIEVLRGAFPRLRCIHLTREDKLRQAISKARAMQTNLWLVGKEHVMHGEAQFDAELIAHCLESAEIAERTWAEFFRRNGIKPLAITYEELCRDHAGTTRRVLDFLHIRPPRRLSLDAPRTVRQADATTEEWVERFTRWRGGNSLVSPSKVERGKTESR